MKLYYVHDPMCSWCWAFRPILLQLKERLPDEIEFIRLLGGLAADNDQPMPEDMRQFVKANWLKIQEDVPGTKFNYDFWSQCQPRRSTYPACRAVIAARQQGHEQDELMTYAIQKAYYLQARNPSETETLIQLAEEIGLDKNQFAKDLADEKINDELLEELKTARRLELNSFPGFLYMDEDKTMQHIHPDYHDANNILKEIEQVRL